jgi:hypothetical protein
MVYRDREGVARAAVRTGGPRTVTPGSEDRTARKNTASCVRRPVAVAVQYIHDEDQDVRRSARVLRHFSYVRHVASW